jgi:hypothetical protein
LNLTFHYFFVIFLNILFLLFYLFNKLFYCFTHVIGAHTPISFYFRIWNVSGKGLQLETLHHFCYSTLWTTSLTCDLHDVSYWLTTSAIHIDLLHLCLTYNAIFALANSFEFRIEKCWTPIYFFKFQFG